MCGFCALNKNTGTLIRAVLKEKTKAEYKYDDALAEGRYFCPIKYILLSCTGVLS